MTILKTNSPKKDKFYMPAEFSAHDGTILIYPERAGSWGKDPTHARVSFKNVICAIAESESVYLACSAKSMPFAIAENFPFNVILFEAETDDSWARDVAPTFVVDGNGGVRGINWTFNAWGGEFDGLYAEWDKDDAFAKLFCDMFGYDYYDASPFVLEGGSIHLDGEGTVMVTESCLLSKGRNPHLTKLQIEEKLKEYLGAEKVLWLPYGIYNDETNEHVDNVCAFVRPAEVVLAWTDNPTDPQYAMSKADLDYLNSVTDAKGRKITVHKLPIPDVPVTVTEADMENYVFAEGEDNREVGERLAASYVNFYFSNNAVVMPAFGGLNAESDLRAQAIMKALCPDRKIIAVPARDILLGGGNIHCITQQIPKKGV